MPSTSACIFYYVEFLFEHITGYNNQDDTVEIGVDILPSYFHNVISHQKITLWMCPHILVHNNLCQSIYVSPANYIASFSL